MLGSIEPKILAFFTSLVSFFCFPNETEVILEDTIFPLSETYFFNKVKFCPGLSIEFHKFVFSEERPDTP